MGQVIPFAARMGAAHDFSAADRARLAELAERYAAAGVRVEVIYGATEEGDPWCVVKDANEEVLIHVARIGDSFVVHYAIDDALRQGKDLRSVLRERLAWEDGPDVVVPFSRQAQNLLALIVAASFFHETVRPGADAGAPISVEPLDDHGSHAVAAAHDAPLLSDAALASKALHAEPTSLAALSGGAAIAAAHHSAVWHDVADETPLRLDHAEVVLARFAGGGPAAPIANLEVAAQRAAAAGAAPIVMAVDAHPPFAAAATTETSTSRTFAPATAEYRKAEETPDSQPPPKTDYAPVGAHWMAVDTDGDGRPDLRIAVPDAPKPEAPEPAAGDHAAILAVGHGFPHHELV